MENRSVGQPVRVSLSNSYQSQGIVLIRSKQNNSEGREGSGVNFVSVLLHGSTWTNGSSKHRGGDSDNPLRGVGEMQKSSATRKSGPDSHVFGATLDRTFF